MRLRVLVAFSVLLLGGCITEKRMARASSRVDLGVAYFREGSLEASVTALEEAHELDPRNWKALNALAVAYAAKDRNDLAGKMFDKALHLNPTEAEILITYGAWLTRTGRPEEAVPVFEKALADMDYRGPALVLSNLSYALTLTNRPDEAVARAREAIRRMPTLCAAYYHLGLAQEGRNDTPAALEAYTTLERTCPTESIGGRLRSACLMAKSGRADARPQLAAVIDEAPNTPIADEARACLALLGTE